MVGRKSPCSVDVEFGECRIYESILSSECSRRCVGGTLVSRHCLAAPDTNPSTGPTAAPPGGPSPTEATRRPWAGRPLKALSDVFAGGRRWCSIRRCSCRVLNPDSFSSSSRVSAPGNACQSSRSGRSDASSATVRSKRSRACSARSRASAGCRVWRSVRLGLGLGCEGDGGARRAGASLGEREL
jgi:hypothetical protein